MDWAGILEQLEKSREDGALISTQWDLRRRDVRAEGRGKRAEKRRKSEEGREEGGEKKEDRRQKINQKRSPEIPK